MGKHPRHILSGACLTYAPATQESLPVRNLRYLDLKQSVETHLQRSWDTLISSMLSQVPGSRFRSRS